MRIMSGIDKILTRNILDKFQGKNPLYVIIVDKKLYPVIFDDILTYEKLYGDQQPVILLDTSVLDPQLTIQVLAIINKITPKARVLRLNNPYRALKELMITGKTVLIVTRKEPDLRTYIELNQIINNNKVYLLLPKVTALPSEYLIIKLENSHVIIQGLVGNEKIRYIIVRGRKKRQLKIDAWLLITG